MKTAENNTIAKDESLSALVAKAKTGDQEAFSELYNRTSTELYRSIRAMTRDEDLSWDIQQDSYLRAFQSLDKLENDEAFLPWLRRIAANVTATKMSKRLPVTFTDLAGDSEDAVIPELPDLNPASQPELSLDRKETSRLVQEILSKLPEGQQMILGMRYYDELSVKEIAQLLKLSDGTVKAALFQGRKKVETAVRALEKQGVKLYGLSPVAFLVALMRRAEPVKGAKALAVKSAVARGAVHATAAHTVPITALTFGQLLQGSLAKIAIGVLFVAAIGGGIWAGSKLLKSDQPVAPYRPTETAEVLLLDRDDPNDPSEHRAEPVVHELHVESTHTTATEPTSNTDSTDTPSEPSHQNEQETKTVRLTLRFMKIKDEFYWLGPEVGDPSGTLSLDIPADWTESMGIFYCPAWSGKVLEPVALFRTMDDAQWDRLVHYDPSERIGEQGEFLYVVPGVDANGRDFVKVMEEIERFWYSCSFYLRDTSGSVVHMVYYMLDPEDQSAHAELQRIIDSIRVEPEGIPEPTSFAPDPDWPSATELEVILARQEQDEAERSALSGTWSVAYGGDTRITEINKVGNRYQAKVVRTLAVTASEAELTQAKQTGTITLNGQEYRYTDSQEQLDEWLEGSIMQHSISVPEDGVILDASLGSAAEAFTGKGGFYEVGKVGDIYVFAYSAAGGFWQRIENTANEDLVWLDGDMPVVEGPSTGNRYTLSAYLQDHSISSGTHCSFQRDTDGEVFIYVDVR